MINNLISAFMLILLSTFIQLANAVEPAKPIEKSSQEIIISTKTIREIRGIHITSWGAGSKKLRTKLLKNIDNSIINAVVIAIKETDGRVYIPGVKIANTYGSTLKAIPKPKEMLKDFDKRGIYTIARIVTFKDSFLPEKFPEFGVKNSTAGIMALKDSFLPEKSPKFEIKKYTGYLWRDRKGGTWTDPYNKKIWKYNLEIAKRAAQLGFDEIQFDYVRYPTEGNISECRYSKPHSSASATKNIANFLKYAKKHLNPYNVKTSAAVFGLTTSANTDMGIGQDIELIAKNTDFVYPMMYPCHYYPGQYGLKNPDSEPYKVINAGLTDALRK
jgi:hypothetical protein